MYSDFDIGLVFAYFFTYSSFFVTGAFVDICSLALRVCNFCSCLVFESEDSLFPFPMSIDLAADVGFLLFILRTVDDFARTAF